MAAVPERVEAGGPAAKVDDDKEKGGQRVDSEVRAAEVRAFFHTHLVDHFRAEEEVLFPTMRSLVAASAPIIDQLLNEHRQIGAGVAQLESEAGLAKSLFDFGDLLERHVRKEERELFPLFEQHIAAHDAEITLAGIKKILSRDRSGG